MPPSLKLIQGSTGEPMTMDEALDDLVRRVKLAKPQTVMVAWETADRKAPQPSYETIPATKAMEEGFLNTLIDRMCPSLILEDDD